MSERLIPLYTVPDGGRFKVPGRRKVFTKRHNMGTIAYQDYTIDGIAVVKTRPGCLCKNSSGRVFEKSWWDWVIEIS